MKHKPVAALPEVAGDLLAAVAHYQSWSADGKERVLQKYAETVAGIAANPDAFTRKLGQIQRAVMKQSYYVVYFLQQPQFTLILAVLDGRRSPVEIRRIISGRKGN